MFLLMILSEAAKLPSRIRALSEDDLRAGANRLGVSARRAEGCIRITYSVLVMAWHGNGPPSAASRRT